jgi:hypothetical protein
VKSSLETSIDELYQGPIETFVEARTALAKTLKGDEARRVKALQKPRVGPWAVNQVYWHARAVYERVAKSGEKLRAAQIAALKGRRTDLRAATDAHHKAIGAAVAEAFRLAEVADVHPAAEELIRTFEALSIARQPPEAPGRLTQPLQPAGFEALAGIAVKARPATPTAPPTRTATPEPTPPAPAKAPTPSTAELAAQRKRVAAIEKADAAVGRAQAAETFARRQWEARKQALDRAIRTLEDVSGKLTR